jgi:hypothetical protein
MKIRLHRGSLEESLATQRTIFPVHAAIRRYLLQDHPAMIERIEVLPYQYDPRIGWDTHIVLVDGSPAAFSDGPMLEWTKGDAQEARLEGWDVFHVNRVENTHEIQRCDDRGIFDSDGDALMHVYDRALDGSTFHRKAIEFTLATTTRELPDVG